MKPPPSLFLSSLLPGHRDSSIWISGIQNHFTRAKSRTQRLTKRRVTTIKRAAAFLFSLASCTPTLEGASPVPWAGWIGVLVPGTARYILPWISPGRRGVTFERAAFSMRWSGMWLKFKLSSFPSLSIYCLAPFTESECVCVPVFFCVWATFRIRPSSDQRLASQCPRLTPQGKCPSQHWISHVNKTSVTSGNSSAAQCVYYSSALQLQYLSCSAE